MLLPALWYLGLAALAAAIIGFVARLILKAVGPGHVPKWLDPTLKWLVGIAVAGMGLFVLIYIVGVALAG